jgi:hypothetical protein
MYTRHVENESKDSKESLDFDLNGHFWVKKI